MYIYIYIYIYISQGYPSKSTQNRYLQRAKQHKNCPD